MTFPECGWLLLIEFVKNDEISLIDIKRNFLHVVNQRIKTHFIGRIDQLKAECIYPASFGYGDLFAGSSTFPLYANRAFLIVERILSHNIKRSGS